MATFFDLLVFLVVFERFWLVFFEVLFFVDELFLELVVFPVFFFDDEDVCDVFAFVFFAAARASVQPNAAMAATAHSSMYFSLLNFMVNNGYLQMSDSPDRVARGASCL
ncbi:MAG: hypothetical protein K2L59_04860 [Muribaculaceae bacterium]|nr:hypothetical protein [Muribaculaceae bacterium]